MESVLFRYLGSKLVFKGAGVLNFTVFDSICPLRGYLPYLAEIHSIVSKKKMLVVVKFTASDTTVIQ